MITRTICSCIPDRYVLVVVTNLVETIHFVVRDVIILSVFSTFQLSAWCHQSSKLVISDNDHEATELDTKVSVVVLSNKVFLALIYTKNLKSQSRSHIMEVEWFLLACVIPYP